MVTYKVNSDKKDELIKYCREVSVYNKNAKIKMYNILMLLIRILWVSAIVTSPRVCLMVFNNFICAITATFVISLFLDGYYPLCVMLKQK